MLLIGGPRDGENIFFPEEQQILEVPILKGDRIYERGRYFKREISFYKEGSLIIAVYQDLEKAPLKQIFKLLIEGYKKC